MYKMCVILAGLLMALPSCGKQPDTTDKPDETPVAFVRYTKDNKMYSDKLKQDLLFDIMLPEGYQENKDKRYPVVYMLHGFGDNNNSWNGTYMKGEQKIKSLEAEGLEPMIYVFPMGKMQKSTGFTCYPYYCNTYDGNLDYMDMFIEEFVPYIDKTYRTIADRGHRATLGYSMGGFGAMILPLKHNETFSVSVPLSMSFRTDEQYINESLEYRNGWDDQWGKIFGGVGQYGENVLTDYYKEHCPFYQFTEKNKTELEKVSWFFHCGDDEEQLEIANDALHIQMRDNGIAHEYRVDDGAHTCSYWRGALEETLFYVQSHFNGNAVWNNTIGKVQTSEVTLDDEGNFISSSYDAEGESAKVIYLASDYESDVIADIISILQRDKKGSFIIAPFNPTETVLADKIAEIEERYNVGKDASHRQAVAFGPAGKVVFAASDSFSRLYFDNADIVEDGAEIRVKPDVFYLAAQSDEGPNYKDMGGLYLACKTIFNLQKESGIGEDQRIGFEYRVRNTNPDATLEILLGAEVIREHIEF